MPVRIVVLFAHTAATQPSGAGTGSSRVVNNLAGSSIGIAPLLQSLGVMQPEADVGHSIYTLLLVEPVAKLMLSGRLTELVLLGQWDGASSLFPAWPPPDWFTRTSGRYYEPQPCPLVASHFRSLASDLRRWHALLPLGDDDGEGLGPGCEHLAIERHPQPETSFRVALRRAGGQNLSVALKPSCHQPAVLLV